MSHREHALALTLFALMPPEQQASVLAVYSGIAAAFPDVRDAFVQAVADELIAFKIDMLLLQQCGAVMQ